MRSCRFKSCSGHSASSWFEDPFCEELLTESIPIRPVWLTFPQRNSASSLIPFSGTQIASKSVSPTWPLPLTADHFGIQQEQEPMSSQDTKTRSDVKTKDLTPTPKQIMKSEQVQSPQSQSQTNPSAHTLSSSRGLMTLSIVAAALLVLVGGVYVYTSVSATEPSYPHPISEELYRTPSVPVTQPVIENVPPPVKEIEEPIFQSNAIIDVPSVGLRSVPNFDAVAKLGSIKRGEPVLIIGRNSDKGPDWVKIKTKSGKVGWVFASVVRERKGG